MTGTLLFLEADPELRDYISGVLRDDGYHIPVMEEIPPTLSQVRAAKPDLICLDINIAGRKGLDLYRSLRKDQELVRVPVIVMSSLEEADTFMESGFQQFIGEENLPKPEGYIERPILLGALKVMISRLLSTEG